jgi:uncharacterized membrane protein YhaH (DUF805 family)
MSSVANPYQAPSAALADAGVRTQPVKLFSVSGRIGRARYIAYSVGMYFLSGLLAVALALVDPLLAFLPYAALFVLLFMLTIQRSHDFNTTGWLSLVMLVPLLNLLFLIIPGTDGANKYGDETPPNTTGVLILAWLFPAIAALGVVAAISIPAYQDYVKRAQQQAPLPKR